MADSIDASEKEETQLSFSNSSSKVALLSESNECRLMKSLRENPQIFEMIAASHSDELSLQQQLRKQFSDDLVRGALTLFELRRKAIVKFTRADAMWFDRRGYEQSTSEAIARHKASRFHGSVVDLCSGIGGDSLALAERCDVTSVDLNPAACLRTEWNAAAYGVDSRLRTVCSDVGSFEFPAAARVHIDPDRRPGSGGRVSRIEDYEPGLPFLHRLIERCAGGAIKVGPACNFGGKFDSTENELISLHGECKEATLWFGDLAGNSPCRATSLPSGETIAGHPLDASAEICAPGRYIFDPDPALVRSGLLDVAAVKLGLHRLDGAEEYLTSDQLIPSAFVAAFEILADLPNNEREIRAWLRSSDFGQVEIKCRHIPVQAEALRRRLPLPGHQPGVLIFAKCDGKTRVLAARRIADDLKR